MPQALYNDNIPHIGRYELSDCAIMEALAARQGTFVQSTGYERENKTQSARQAPNLYIVQLK
jgi:hypothetical protein